jgi:hypothetical protein
MLPDIKAENANTQFKTKHANDMFFPASHFI